MRAGEARVALERRAHELRQWLGSAAPVRPDLMQPRHAASERDAVERAVHRDMVARIAPSRAYHEAVKGDRPRFGAADLRSLGLGYMGRRREHALRVSKSRESLEVVMDAYRFDGIVCQSLIEARLSSLAVARQHADEVRAAGAEAAAIEATLHRTRDVPAMSTLHVAPGQPLQEAVERHAMNWRERVIRKGMTDAIGLAFSSQGRVATQQDGEEAALLRSHMLYSDMFSASLREMRRHPDAVTDPAGAERSVRRMVLDAIGSGGDPMDALVRGIQEARERTHQAGHGEHDLVEESLPVEDAPAAPSFR